MLCALGRNHLVLVFLSIKLTCFHLILSSPFHFAIKGKSLSLFLFLGGGVPKWFLGGQGATPGNTLLMGWFPESSARVQRYGATWSLQRWRLYNHPRVVKGTSKVTVVVWGFVRGFKVPPSHAPRTVWSRTEPK